MKAKSIETVRFLLFAFFASAEAERSNTDLTEKEECSMKHYISDPTANTAIANVDRERRRQERRGDARNNRPERRKPVSREKAPSMTAAPIVWRMVRFDENGRKVEESKYIETKRRPRESPPGDFSIVQVHNHAA